MLDELDELEGTGAIIQNFELPPCPVGAEILLNLICNVADFIATAPLVGALSKRRLCYRSILTNKIHSLYR